MPAESPTSRLFHAIVLMGCALAPLEGCNDSKTPFDSGVDATVDAGVDATVDHDASTDAGWPPTK